MAGNRQGNFPLKCEQSFNKAPCVSMSAPWSSHHSSAELHSDTVNLAGLTFTQSTAARGHVNTESWVRDATTSPPLTSPHPTWANGSSTTHLCALVSWSSTYQDCLWSENKHTAKIHVSPGKYSKLSPPVIHFKAFIFWKVMIFQTAFRFCVSDLPKSKKYVYFCLKFTAAFTAMTPTVSYKSFC